MWPKWRTTELLHSLKLIIRGASGCRASAKDEQARVEERRRFCHVCFDSGQAVPAGVMGAGGRAACIPECYQTDLDIGNVSLRSACYPARKGREERYVFPSLRGSSLESKGKMHEARRPQEQDSAFLSLMLGWPIFLLLLNSCLDFLVLGLAPVAQCLSSFQAQPAAVWPLFLFSTMDSFMSWSLPRGAPWGLCGLHSHP